MSATSRRRGSWPADGRRTRASATTHTRTGASSTHADSPPTPVPSERGDYSRFYELFRDAVRGDGAAPVDPTDSVRGLRVLEAAERSARTGTVVQVGAS